MVCFCSKRCGIIGSGKSTEGNEEINRERRQRRGKQSTEGNEGNEADFLKPRIDANRRESTRIDAKEKLRVCFCFWFSTEGNEGNEASRAFVCFVCFLLIRFVDKEANHE